MEKKIDLWLEPAAFFQERVSEAMARQNFETIQVAEFYLVDLLSRFMFAENLFSEAQKNREETLAELFLKAQKTEHAEKIRLFRKLGDTSLYISGFFGESLNRKVIDLDYYREMGTIAYRNLTGVIRENTFQELYTELHNKFEGFVKVLAEVSREITVQNNRDLITLYETFLRTGDLAAKQKLEEMGVLPGPQADLNRKKPTN